MVCSLSLGCCWVISGCLILAWGGQRHSASLRCATLQPVNAHKRSGTALSLNVGLGVVGGLLIWPIAYYFFGNVFKIEDSLRPEMQGAVPWLILAVPMATLSGVLSGALQGRERFFELNLISVTGTVIFQLLPLAAATIWAADLGVLLPVALSARVLTLLMLFELCRRHLLLGHAATFVRQQAGQLLRFGGWVTVTSFIGPMMVVLDRFLIGVVSGAKSVTYYAVPFQIGENSSVIPNALISALFPRFAVNTPQEQKQLANLGLQTLVVVMTPLVAVGIMVMEPFLAWWISPNFAMQSAAVGQIILLSFWVNSFAKIPYAQLQARGRPDLVAKCHLAELLPYLGLLYLGLNVLGLVGAAVAFFLRVTVDLALLAGLAGTLKLIVRTLPIPSILLLVASLIATTGNLDLRYRATLIAIHLMITIIWAWRHAPVLLKEFALVQLKPLTKFLAKP